MKSPPKSLNMLICGLGVLQALTDHKIVHDSVHGSVRFDGLFRDLLEVPDLQRLHSIHQLGLAYLVYPGANHTRFEHSIGTFAVARRICAALQMDREEAKVVECAALLHDIGHLPYSHTLEFVLHNQFGIDHTEISRRLIRGKETVLSDSDRRILGRSPTVTGVLEKHGVDPDAVARLLEAKPPSLEAQKTLHRDKGQSHFNSKRYLAQIVNGPVDADQLDYLKRDAHYTGVAYGVIDLERLLQTLEVFNGDLVINRNGLSAIEGMLVARALMFSSVYFHKTVRISELMLAKAVEFLGEDDIQIIHSMTDASLLAYLVSRGGYFEEVATLIKYRRLYKKVFGVRSTEVDQDGWDEVDRLGNVASRRSAEMEIAKRAGVDPGRVIIDVPSSELSISEPRISLTDIRVVDGGKVRMLPKISSIAASLQNRRAHEWAVMVSCPQSDKDKVAKASAKVLLA